MSCIFHIYLPGSDIPQWLISVTMRDGGVHPKLFIFNKTCLVIKFKGFFYVIPIIGNKKQDPLTIYGGEHVDYVGGGKGVIIKRNGILLKILLIVSFIFMILYSISNFIRYWI